MNLHKLILTKNNCYKAGDKLKVRGLMLHSTGANNPNLKRYVGPDDGLLGVNDYGNHWNQPRPDGQSKCVHGFIGKLEDGTIATYQTLPWDMQAWHSGGEANGTHIGIEICEDDLKDAVYFNKVYQEAVEVFAHLCKEFDLAPLKDGVILCHSEGAYRDIASNHGDVMHWFPKHGKSMDTFRKDVNAQMGKGTVQEAEKQLYRVRKSWSDAKSQLGAFEDLNNAKRACKEGYKVFDAAGKVVYDPAKTTAAPSAKPAAPAYTPVKDHQSWLKSRFGFKLEADNAWGPITNRESIRALQKLTGPEKDGIWGPNTAKYCPCLGMGDGGDLVTLLQGILAGKHGYTDVKRDGDFGSITCAAVKKFQKAHGLTADGLAGVLTWKALLA